MHANKKLIEALRVLIKRIRTGYDGLPQGHGIKLAEEALAAHDAEQVSQASEPEYVRRREQEAAFKDGWQAAQAVPAYTEGHCKEKAKPGGCQLHNLHCGYPACDRKTAPAAPAPEASQPEPDNRARAAAIAAEHILQEDYGVSLPAQSEMSKAQRVERLMRRATQLEKHGTVYDRLPPETTTRSQKLAAAGFTARDTRLECDECGAKVSAQMLPVHKCEARAAGQELPPLPEPLPALMPNGDRYGYTADQMHAYASAALAQRQPLTEWQPIETAPKRGFVLVAALSGYRGTPLRIAACEWSDDYQAWMTHSHDRFTDGGNDAAWWMPLPAAPGATTGEQHG